MTTLSPSGRQLARREVLLEQLVKVFLAEGFAELSMADLATRLRCSKSTLYLAAPSKEQVVVAVVRHYFRRAADRVESRVESCPHPAARLPTYLTSVAEELRPAAPAFYADLAGFAPAAEVYRQNTDFAARRVQDLVTDGVTAGLLRPVDAGFVGAVAAQVMTAIQSGEIEAVTGLDAAAAYHQLADLVMRSLTSG
jgi:AcrR family transcriptional regulator